MSIFYKNLLRLCAEKKVSPSGVAKTVGLSNAAASGWKNGKMPSDTTLVKLADYFNVPVSYFNEEQKDSTLQMFGSLDDEGIKNPAPNDGNGDKILTKDTLGVFLRQMSTEDLASLAAQIALVIAERSSGSGEG